MQAKEIMTSEVVCAKANQTVRDVAKMMKDNDTGIIPIVKEEKNLLGVVTDRDIVVRCIAGGGDLNQAVDAIMTPNPICAGPDSDLDEIADLMHDNQVKRICITEGNILKGIVSLADLAVTDEDDAEEALEGISRGARAESHLEGGFQSQQGHP